VKGNSYTPNLNLKGLIILHNILSKISGKKLVAMVR